MSDEGKEKRLAVMRDNHQTAGLSTLRNKEEKSGGRLEEGLEEGGRRAAKDDVSRCRWVAFDESGWLAMVLFRSR